MFPQSAFSPVLRSAAPAILLAVAVLAPFHDKAFTIDDTLFLSGAEQVVRDPLRPSAFVVVWDTDVPIRASSGIFVSGPVTAYLLVPCILLGGVEWAAHLTHWLLLCCGVLATVSLARRLGSDAAEAGLAGLLLVTAPAVLATASTSMPDTPAMALGVCGIERAVAWRQERKWAQAILAATFLALAMLTRVHLALLLVVVACLELDAKPAFSIKGMKRWFPLAGAATLTLLVLWIMRDPDVGAAGHAQTLGSMLHLWPVRSNLLAQGINWTLAIPLAIPWLLLRFSGLDWRLAAMVSVAVMWVKPAEAPWWLAAVSAAGGVAVCDILWTAFRGGDRTHAALALWLLLPFPTIVYWHSPAKYHVAAAPAVALIVVFALRGAGPRLRRFVSAGAVACGLVLSVLIIRADSILADLGRSAAQELILPRAKRGERVWFAGHWGFQWYAEKAGALPLTLTPPHPSTGDTVVRSAVDSCDALSRFPNRTLVYARSYSAAGGRVMSRSDNTGFFSNVWGYLPWTWGRSEINRFEVWRMN